MELKTHFSDKVVSAAHAVSHIKRGSRVFIGTGCGEPQQLIKAMVADPALQDVMIYQMLSFTLSKFVEDDQFLGRFSLKLFFISSPMRQAAFDGKIDYIPTYLSEIPKLFATNRIGLDVALIQVSPPDRFGFCSLGVSVDITRAALENASVVIAQVNARMPRTWGDSFVHLDNIDLLVPYDEPLVEALPTMKSNAVARRIGYYVNQLVHDGATIHLGFGNLPYAILKHLDNKKDLGVHTQMITDAFLPLFEKNVINNKKKTLLPGRVTTSLCMGSEKLYRFVDNNPIFYFRSSEFVNDPAVIARNDNLVSITSALEVDLTGQVCSDSMGYLFYSGIGDQVDFLRGCAMSAEGFSIIALPATTRGGEASRIVSHLSEGAGVATTRGDVNFVVTEYGIAELKGKGIFQRVMELAQIAHPKFRKELVDIAKKHHYIFADQLPPINEDLLFLEGYKSTFSLKGGKTVEVRPLLPSDEFAYRNFFYSLKEKTIYLRFFYRLKLFSHHMVQEQWAAVDYRKNMTLIGLTQIRGYKEIMAIATYAWESDTLAEVAFVVREDFQQMGVSSYLLGELEKIARENGYTGFSATVLSENSAMLHVLKKRYPLAEVRPGMEGDIRIEMTFAETPPAETNSKKKQLKELLD